MTATTTTTSTSTTSTSTTSTTATARAGVLRLAASAEWTKLRTARTTTVDVGIALTASIVVGALAAAGRRQEWSTLAPAARAELDPTSTSLVGVVVAALVVGSLGVRSVAAEHASGMIRLTFAAMPHRRTVLAVKMALTAVVGVAVAGVANVVAVVIGRRILEPTGVTAGLADPGVLRAVAFGAIGVGLVVAMAVAIGALLRRAAPANIVLALVVVGGQLVGAALPDGAARALPSAALEALVTTNPTGDTLDPRTALVVLAAQTALLGAAAWRDIERRDP